jgi:hypothetical protein
MKGAEVHLDVNESRVEVTVTEQVGDRLQRLVLVEHPRGKAMAKAIRTGYR